MTEERSPSDSTDEGMTDSTGDAVEQQPKTVEEVEAFWRNRFSSRDRAHNAETAALKAQMEAMRAAPVPPPVNESPEAARVRELEQALQQERAARQVEALKNRYPYAASVLGDSVADVPVEKLAAIEAIPESGSTRMNEPNMAGRANTAIQPQGTGPAQAKTKDELLADLARIAPAYQQAAKEGLL